MENEYVDTRSVWPTYVKGIVAVSLPGKPHTISVEDARDFVKEITK